jgi:hypothetical protein
VPLKWLGRAGHALRSSSDLVRVSRGAWRGHLICGVYQDGQGRWMVYWHGRTPQEVDWENPPPELVGRGHVIQGVFRRPEA